MTATATSQSGPAEGLTPSTTPVEPGVKRGLDFPSYLRIEAVNWSRVLKHFAKTAAHAHYAMTHPETEEKDAYVLGDAADAAILRPDEFKGQYCCPPEKWDMRTKIGKEAFAEWKSGQPADSIILTPDEYGRAVGMRDAVWNNGDAALLLSGPGDTQLSMVWKDAETGLLCKGRIDRRCRAMGLNLIVDLKTTRNGQTWAFTSDIAKYRYHAQLAFYVDGLATLAPAERHVVFLVVEKDPPHCSRLVGLSPEALDAGRAEYRRYLNQYIHARDTGQWPGYPPGIEWVGLPKWAAGMAAIEEATNGA